MHFISRSVAAAAVAAALASLLQPADALAISPARARRQMGGSSGYFQPTTVLTANDTEFGTYIEGAAVDVSGSAYAVNFGANTDTATLGRIDFSAPGAGYPADVKVTAQTKIFGYDPVSQFNGIRVVCDDGEGSRVLLVADKQNKRIVKVVETPGMPAVGSIFCSSPDILTGVPNDLAVDYVNQRVYLSGMAWTSETVPADGELWMCSKDGKATKLSDAESIQGRTNGIELSNDGKTLYVSEALNKMGGPVSNKILTFSVNPDGTVDKSSRKVFYDFAEQGTGNVDIDGFRVDVEGNLYVTRNGNGQVVVFNKDGEILETVKLVGTNFPTNVELAGPDGKMAVAVGRCGDSPYGTGVGCVDVFAVPYAGRAFSYLLSAKSEACAWI